MQVNTQENTGTKEHKQENTQEGCSIISEHSADMQAVAQARTKKQDTTQQHTPVQSSQYLQPSSFCREIHK